MSSPPPRIAVIGAGLSGLAVAHALVDGGAAVHVYERTTRPGGNADTRRTLLGDRRVELGTSDFNRAAYRRVVAALDRLGVPYRPMHNSTGFFTEDGALVYALGRRHGVPPPDDVLIQLRRFRRQAYEALEDPRLGALSLDEYLEVRDYSSRFAELYLRPRVHALWFCGPDGPGVLPMAAIMRFYALQEGLVLQGDPRPERMYLPEGVGSFVDALVNALPVGTVRTGAPVRVRVGDGLPRVHAAPGDAHPGPGLPYDAVVLATHADDGAALLDGPGAAPWQAVLSRFPYQEATVVAHTDARLLGPNPNAWGTFNVLVREPVGPYTVTVAGPLHQNDAEHPDRRGALQPWFFTTANPWRPIPEQLLLR
ncbi:MAG: NAD(P)-binding protein, partial [Myxococcota bacterium]